jgi:hypothetical protein
MSEWVDLVPAVLGHLLLIVHDLLPGCTLVDCYPSPGWHMTNTNKLFLTRLENIFPMKQ